MGEDARNKEHVDFCRHVLRHTCPPFSRRIDKWCENPGKFRSRVSQGHPTLDISCRTGPMTSNRTLGQWLQSTTRQCLLQGRQERSTGGGGGGAWRRGWDAVTHASDPECGTTGTQSVLMSPSPTRSFLYSSASLLIRSAAF